MKKLLSLILAIGVIASVSAVRAQDGNIVPAPSLDTNQSVATATATPGLYKNNEVSVGISTSYRFSSSLRDLSKYNVNAAAEVAYFPSKYIGVEASLPFYNSTGVTIQDINADIVIRYPINIASHLAFAPYIGGGADYNWINNDISPLAKAGISLRFNQGWEIFGEYDYQLVSFSQYEGGESSVKAGLRLNF